jgi:hypothetical protein
MNASNSSLGTVVENAGVVTVVLVDVPSRDTTLSMANCPERRGDGEADGYTVIQARAPGRQR